MENIEKWYSREVLQWRSGSSVAWASLSVPLITFLYVLAANFYVHHPLLWITDFTGTICTYSFIATVALLMLINGGYFTYQLNTFTVIPSVSVVKFSHLPQLLSPAIIAHTCVCSGMGFFLGWICTCILGGRYGALTDRCEPNSEVHCINEYHLFLVLYGGFSGTMYILYHYVRQNNVICFPQVQQAKFFQIRQKALGLFWSSLMYVVWQLKFYYLLFYLLGHIPRDWIAATLSLNYRSDFRLDSLYGLLLDVGLLWQTLLLGIFIQLTWSYAALLYKVYNTEAVEFPISTMFDNFKNKCLVDAMSCTSQPLIQALGFLDLKQLARHSMLRRKELFSLSQPGGHPVNWEKIVSVCVSVLKELNAGVQETNWKILANAPLRQPEKSSSNTNGIGEGDAKTSGEQSQSVRQRIVNGIKKRPIMDFFSEDSAEWKNRKLFASAFIQIWTVEALASLVEASFVEDVYGVVQMSLPEIIKAMLNLQENMDKHFKLTGGVSKRVQKDSVTGTDQPLKYQLHTALKTSVYSIENRFGEHFSDFKQI